MAQIARPSEKPLNWGQYARLKKMRRVQFRNALEQLDAGASNIASQVDQIRNLDSLLAAHPWRKAQDALGAAVIAAIAVGVLAVLSLMPVSRPFIVLTAAVDAVRVKLPESHGFSWSGRPLQLDSSNDGLRFVGFEFRGWQTLPGARAGTRPTCPDALHLESLALGAGGSLSLEYDADGRLDVKSEDAPMTGELECKGSPEGPAEFATFVPRGQAPIQRLVSLTLREPWLLGDLAARELAFVRQIRSMTTQGERPTISSIHSGTLRFRDTDQETVLRDGDRLTLSGVSGNVNLSIHPSERNMTLRYEGTVDTVKRDGRGVMPSWLVYGRRNANLAVFLSAFAAVWGTLWAIRRWLHA